MKGPIIAELAVAMEKDHEVLRGGELMGERELMGRKREIRPKKKELMGRKKGYLN